MIVVDIETSGLDPRKHGILEMAGLKFENPDVFFHSYCGLDKEDEIDSKALEINGFTEEETRDLSRPTQKKALDKFFKWIEERKDFYAAGENVGSFDLNFIKVKADKYGLIFPFQYRSYDLNTAAVCKYERIYCKLPIVDGKIKVGLPQILELVGMKDERGKHEVLEDCRLEAECISRLRHGRGLFLEYSKFKIPDYLLKNDNLQ